MLPIDRLAIGTSCDVHRFKQGVPLILGGVTVPFDRGMDAHSDGDVLMHAVLDAVLSAAALPDLGTLFPDTDERNRGRSSVDMAREVARRLSVAGTRILSLDAVVIGWYLPAENVSLEDNGDWLARHHPDATRTSWGCPPGSARKIPSSVPIHSRFWSASRCSCPPPPSSSSSASSPSSFFSYSSGRGGSGGAGKAKSEVIRGRETPSENTGLGMVSPWTRKTLFPTAK